MNVTIIRSTGTEEIRELSRRVDPMRQIEELIEAQSLDIVNLRDGRVMIVDGDGWETREVRGIVDSVEYVSMVPVRARKPINEKATALYHGVCRPGTTHQIVGDVAIAVDADFA